MATHSSILAWDMSWTKEPGGIVYGVTKNRNDWATQHTAHRNEPQKQFCSRPYHLTTIPGLSLHPLVGLGLSKLCGRSETPPCGPCGHLNPVS